MEDLLYTNKFISSNIEKETIPNYSVIQPTNQSKLGNAPNPKSLKSNLLKDLIDDNYQKKKFNFLSIDSRNRENQDIKPNNYKVKLNTNLKNKYC